MALTRKFLTALGIEADKTDEIISAHAETVDALKKQRDEYKEDAEKLPKVQKQLDDLKKEVGSGEKPFETKYNDLKKEHDDYKAQQESKEMIAKKEAAYRSLLKDAGVSEKRIDTVLRVTKLDDVELSDDGKIKDADKLTESIKSEWADFIVIDGKRGAETSKPPQNNGGKTLTKADIMAIKDGTERRKAIAENPSLFGLTSSNNNE